MRITSGEFRGRLLIIPDTAATHPMGSRERLALFNSLGDITSARVLDCFAGSGALGLEALSRGAASATFIDSSPKAVAAIRQNIKSLNVETRTDVIKVKLESFREQGKYDLIFADPPYDHFETESLKNLPEIIAPGGRLVLSHPASVQPEGLFSGLKLLSTKKYARARISIYTK